MPALGEGSVSIPAVASFSSLLSALLDEAGTIKQTSTIEPALNKSDFVNLSQRVSTCLSTNDEPASQDGSAPSVDTAKSRQFAVIETAARDLFGRLIATTPIDSPGFVRMWNLLDILSMLSDDGQCEPALLFWLVEELLDSQTIAGCRTIFDFLESRRERITTKHFKQKNLVILRSCNELLRRLSRAEDTAFCGRVFIFMFQSFPLGDRSSVNLRGEYHVENITNYESATTEDDSKMDVDTQTDASKDTGESKLTPKGVTFDAKDEQKATDLETLYPGFWSLQENFSQPMKLLEPAQFAKFKDNLASTIKAFQAFQPGESSRSSTSVDESKRNLKRKRGEDENDDPQTAFNPKYLTSKDLFELEVSDLSFRRHVLVQALIIMDFLLSLSSQAKEKLATVNASNKAVIYPTQLTEQDTKWTTEMKRMISDYLRQGPDGPYFYRMVETVLARDKNWVVWKMASCPPIQRDPVSPEVFMEAKATVQRTATNKRLRAVPMGSVSLDFLREQDGAAAMEELKAEKRYRLPDLDSFKRKIADDDFEIDMPTSDETKAAAVAGKASKSWRALRIASRFKLASFDKIDDPKKIDAVFEDVVDAGEDEDADEPTASEEDMPANREPIIIAGPVGAGKSALVGKLLEQHKGVFASAVRHTTRTPGDGEVNGRDYLFVKQLEFNQLRDGDRLIEYGTRDGCDYGTSSKVIDAIVETGKVPVIELDIEAAQYAKDMDYSARFILVRPPSDEELEGRLKSSGRDDAAVRQVLDKLPADLDEAKVEELFDTTVVNDDLGESAAALAEYIFAKEDPSSGREASQDVSVVGDTIVVAT